MATFTHWNREKSLVSTNGNKKISERVLLCKLPDSKHAEISCKQLKYLAANSQQKGSSLTQVTAYLDLEGLGKQRTLLSYPKSHPH